jgi:Flp pilus assembly protein protease CpaA
VTAQRSLPFERCNIGPAEIARRRRLAILLTAVTVLIVAALVAAQVPTLGRLAVFPFAAAVGVTWLQVIRKFCVHFGAFGLENFGALGDERPVAREVRAADRRQSLEMVLEGVLFGLVVTLAVLQLPA